MNENAVTATKLPPSKVTTRSPSRPPARPSWGRRSFEDDLLHVEVARPESGPGVLEVEVPHPREHRVEAELVHALERVEEPLVPQPQRLGVVLPEGQPFGYPQRGVVAVDVHDRLGR